MTKNSDRWGLTPFIRIGIVGFAGQLSNEYSDPMNLRLLYADEIRKQGFSTDKAQAEAVETLDRIANELITYPARHGLGPHLKRRYLSRFIPSLAESNPVRGTYLWGGVGRGKTFMMDLFFESLPFEDKLRFHFHRLMYRLHGQLRQLKNVEDPLERVAEDLSRKARVICIDEFFVSDIADAMLLGKLLDAMFRRGIALVTTSNIPPDDLYAGGLQRQLFLPAIGTIKNHTDIVHISGDTDYRLRVLETAEIFHTPLDTAATDLLNDYFARIAPDTGTRGQEIEILGRNIRTQRRADGVVWFDFIDLCDGPRSQDDYIEVARCFQAVILSNVPVMDRQKENQARRLISLVDEFYDRNVKLIISAAASIDALYTGSKLGREFERTQSRLREMQSTSYLAAQHRA
jgi:cell division protein ZapE